MHVWEIVIKDIHKYGIFPNSAQCEGGWRTITVIFKRHVDHSRVSDNDRRRTIDSTYATASKLVYWLENASTQKV